MMVAIQELTVKTVFQNPNYALEVQLKYYLFYTASPDPSTS